jgi:hypothetical protein
MGIKTCRDIRREPSEEICATFNFGDELEVVRGLLLVRGRKRGMTNTEGRGRGTRKTNMCTAKQKPRIEVLGHACDDGETAKGKH